MAYACDLTPGVFHAAVFSVLDSAPRAYIAVRPDPAGRIARTPFGTNKEPAA